MDQQPQPSSAPPPAAPPTSPGMMEVPPPKPRRFAPEVTVPPFAGSPFFWIWLRPRGVVRNLLNGPHRWWMYLFPILASFDSGLSNASDAAMGNKYSFAQIGALCLVFAALTAMLSVWVGSWLVHLIGRALGGRATRSELRAASCWSCIPLAQLMLLWIPYVAAFGADTFTSNRPRFWDPGAPPVLLAGGLLEAALTTWAVVISLFTLAEAHRFSFLRALATALVAAFVVAVAGCGLFMSAGFLTAAL